MLPHIHASFLRNLFDDIVRVEVIWHGSIARSISNLVIAIFSFVHQMFPIVKPLYSIFNGCKRSKTSLVAFTDAASEISR